MTEQYDDDAAVLGTDSVVAEGWKPAIPSSQEQWESDSPTSSDHGIGAVTKSAGLRNRDGIKVRLTVSESRIEKIYHGVNKQRDDFLTETGHSLRWVKGERILQTPSQTVDDSRHPDSEFWGLDSLSPEEKAERLDALSAWTISGYDESMPPIVPESELSRHDPPNPYGEFPCVVRDANDRVLHTIPGKPPVSQQDRKVSRQQRKSERARQRMQRHRDASTSVDADALIRAERAREEMKANRRRITQQYVRDYELYRD